MHHSVILGSIEKHSSSPLPQLLAGDHLGPPSSSSPQGSTPSVVSRSVFHNQLGKVESRAQVENEEVQGREIVKEESLNKS